MVFNLWKINMIQGKCVICKEDAELIKIDDCTQLLTKCLYGCLI